jgi:hypothetical protein
MIRETSKVKETSYIYCDIVDQAYIEEYKIGVGEQDMLVKNLQNQREQLAGKSQYVNSMLEKEQAILKKI